VPVTIGEGDGNGAITVAVVEEHEILRRGLIASLADDGRLHVISGGSEDRAEEDVDVAVVSGEAARRASFSCPIIVFSDDPEGPQAVAEGNTVAGVLELESLTVAQLNATVHAAAAGLRINTRNAHGVAEEMIDPRSRRVLELIAAGCSTREIAEHMSYSERTIKKIVKQLQGRLDARTRA
jgi:DNA-binding NarL/FixJ family response regulator